MDNPLFRIRRFVLALAVTAALSLCASGAHAQPGSSSGSPQIYLLRGLANLSPGLDDLADMIREHGLPASVDNHLASGVLTVEIEQDYRHGHRPIILIGHSLGAGAVIAMAQDLGEAGIPVALVVTIDPVTHLEMPRNVRRQLNLYVSSGIGMSAERGRKSHGVLVNKDYEGQAQLDHFSITTSRRVQRRILENVLAAARYNGTRHPRRSARF